MQPRPRVVERATERNDGLVPPGQEEQARLAAANCPELAIEISEDQ